MKEIAMKRAARFPALALAQFIELSPSYLTQIFENR
jgi:hypothetical protein